MGDIKKTITFVAIIAITITSAFSYNGDVQLHTGYRGGISKADFPNDVYNMEITSHAIEFDIENWNLFGSGNVFSWGFMEGVSFFVGGISNVDIDEVSFNGRDSSAILGINYYMAPALALTFGNVMKVQTAVGFTFGFYGLSPMYDDEIENYIVPVVYGAMAEMQAKLFPHTRVNPMLGFRYSYTRAESYYYREKIKRNYYYTSDDDATIKEPFFMHSFSIYLGIAINWGDY